jgi:hypothetical protein
MIIIFCQLTIGSDVLDYFKIDVESNKKENQSLTQNKTQQETQKTWNLHA